MTLLLVMLCCADFRAEYLPAASKLEAAYARCQAKVVITVTNDKDDYLGKTNYAFALDGNKAKFDRTIQENGKIVFRRVVSGTPDLSFMILTKDGDTILEHVDRSGDTYCFATVVEQADTVRAAFACFGKTLSERLASKSFQLKSVSREDGAVRLEFADVEPDGFAIDGWVRLLADRQWIIDRSEFNLKRGDHTWRRTEQVNYNALGVASVDAMTFNPDRTHTATSVVEQLDFGPVPASEFTLSHYGYDDRIGLPGRFPWLWLAIGSLVVVGVAVWGGRIATLTKPRHSLRG